MLWINLACRLANQAFVGKEEGVVVSSAWRKSEVHRNRPEVKEEREFLEPKRSQCCARWASSHRYV